MTWEKSDFDLDPFPPHSFSASVARCVTAQTFTATSEIHWTMRCALRDRLSRGVPNYFGLVRRFT